MHFHILSKLFWNINFFPAFLGKIYEGDAKELISTLIQKDLISADEYEDLKKHWKGGDKRE